LRLNMVKDLLFQIVFEPWRKLGCRFMLLGKTKSKGNGLLLADIKQLKELELVAYVNKMGIEGTVKDLKADTLRRVLEKMGEN
jgi:hypothetical protein